DAAAPGSLVSPLDEPAVRRSAPRLANDDAAARGKALSGMGTASVVEFASEPSVLSLNVTVPAAFGAVTVPLSTERYAGFTSTTMKSVPRMPIVACDATSENASGLRFP